MYVKTGVFRVRIFEDKIKEVINIFLSKLAKNRQQRHPKLFQTLVESIMDYKNMERATKIQLIPESCQNKRLRLKK